MTISTRDLMLARLRTALGDRAWRGNLFAVALLAVGLLILVAGSGLFSSVAHARATVAEVIPQETAYGPRVSYAVAFPDGHRLIAASAERTPQEAPGDVVCVRLRHRLFSGRDSAALAPPGDCAQRP